MQKYRKDLGVAQLVVLQLLLVPQHLVQDLVAGRPAVHLQSFWKHLVFFSQSNWDGFQKIDSAGNTQWFLKQRVFLLGQTLCAGPIPPTKNRNRSTKSLNVNLTGNVVWLYSCRRQNIKDVKRGTTRKTLLVITQYSYGWSKWKRVTIFIHNRTEKPLSEKWPLPLGSGRWL